MVVGRTPRALKPARCRLSGAWGGGRCPGGSGFNYPQNPKRFTPKARHHVILRCLNPKFKFLDQSSGLMVYAVGLCAQQELFRV